MPLLEFLVFAVTVACLSVVCHYYMNNFRDVSILSGHVIVACGILPHIYVNLRNATVGYLHNFLCVYVTTRLGVFVSFFV